MTIIISNNLFNLNLMFLTRETEPWYRSVLCTSMLAVPVYLSCCLWFISSLSVNGTPARSSAPPSPDRCRLSPTTEDMTPLWLTWFLPQLLRTLTASLTVWGSQPPASGEMSAVSPEHIHTGEQNRTGGEPELHQAGLLQPQTVFVILDSSETLNLVRWVSSLGPTQSEPAQTPIKQVLLSGAPSLKPLHSWARLHNCY